MLKNVKCANFRKGFFNCEICIINKDYVHLQNTKCQSCFKPIIELEK